MTTVNSLYELFSLSPDCTDDELRRAYHRAVLQHHPDLNPHESKNATAETQHLITTYATLKKFRKHGVEPLNFGAEVDLTATSGPEVWISFDFSSVDIKNIARRKKSFRQACEAFRQNPSDVLRALRLINAAFEAERQDVIDDLLRNPILIDAASLLLSSVDSWSACETLNRWAEFLYENHLVKEGIQILEDAFSSGKAPNEVEELLKEELRSMHYKFAQDYSSRTKRKPAPAVRIEHFNRILELDPESGYTGYTYKFLAEAYHELGDDTQARIHLERAYKIDPQLDGAVRISRALGFLPAKKTAPPKEKSRAKYKYTQLKHIPSPSQIREWAVNEKWNDLLAFADLTEYSPRILSKSRSTLCQIASSLGSCRDTQAKNALTSLLDSFYWDVKEASIVSLSKIGDRKTLHILQNLKTYTRSEEYICHNAISYLKARLEIRSSADADKTTKELIKRANQVFEKGNFGLARFLLENIATTIENNDPLYFDVIILLARACGEMGDSREAINLIKTLFATLPKKYQRQISQELTVWLWELLFSEPYDSTNDGDYLLALDILLERALSSNEPDEVLKNLRYLTRWLELLGEGEMTQWIRLLIRTEAPGTEYVDDSNREQYIRGVILSEGLRVQLVTIYSRIKTEIPNKLSQVLQSSKAFKDSTQRLHS